MNKYTELSDFEINKHVFVATKIEHEDTDLHSNKVFYGDGANWIEFNPCNNPADAWPVILKNEININFRESVKSGVMAEKSGWSEIYSINKNPLRAAMEVFLMIKDAENES